MDIRADFPETNQLLNTIFYERPQYEILQGGHKGDLISGYDGILLSGPFNTGKTMDILLALRFTVMYQEATNNKRQIHVGVVRESTDSFIDNFVSKIQIFNEPMKTKNGSCGFFVYDRNRRAKCVWRFRGVYPNGAGQFEEDGTLCEIVFHSWSVNSGSKADVDKWKGGEVTIVVFNEMNNYSENAYDTLSPRKDRFPFEGATFQYWIGDINPSLKSDWDYKRFFKNKANGVKVIQYESPLIWVPDENGTKKYLGQKGRYTENKKYIPRTDKGYSYWHSMTDGTDKSITNYVFGQYYSGSAGTAVHKYFSGTESIKEILPPSLDTVIVVAADFGWKNGFISGYFSEMDFTPNGKKSVELGSGLQFNIMDSYYGEGGWNKTWQHILMKLFVMPDYIQHYEANRIMIVGDPRTMKKHSLTGGDQSIHIMQEAGFYPTVPVNELGIIVDDISYRVETTEKYIKQNRLKIHPRNAPLITALVSGYVTKKDSNEPDKKKSGGYAEVMDSLQYALTWKELGGKEEDHVEMLNASRFFNNNVTAVNLYNV